MDDFGDILRRHRTARALSLRQLGRLAHLDHSYISQVERGTRRASRTFAETCDRALNANGALIEVYDKQAGNIDMRRRTVLLQAMGVLAAGAAGPLIGLEALRHGLGVAMDDRHEWEKIVADYGRDFYTTPVDDLRERLRGDFIVLESQLAATPADAELLRAAAHLSVITAMCLSSAGQQGVTRRWWRIARTCADQSADLDARLWVRDWEVVNGTYERRPTGEILARADETVGIANGRVCVGHVGTLSGRAQALAVAGRPGDAITALTSVADMTERLPGTVTDDHDSMFGWPEVRLRHTESFVYTHTGRTREALAAQDRALELYPVELGRERAQMQMHRASCLIQDGHIADGLRYAADVLDDLPPADHTAMLYQVAWSVVTVVPRSERRRVEVEELRDRLVALPSG